MPQRIMFVIGTRPEAIKLAPVVLAAQRPGLARVSDLAVVRTSQHREMLDQVLADFDLHADFDLDVMRSNQDLAHVTSEVLCRLRDVTPDRASRLGSGARRHDDRVRRRVGCIL